MVDETYPGIDLALVSGHQSGDVVLKNGGERCCISDRTDPGWELRVPACIALLLE